MAWSLHINAVTHPNQPSWGLDPVEWLRTPPSTVAQHIRDVNLTDGYRDRVLVLTADELREWHSRDRHLAFKPPYDYSGWQQVLAPKIADLERVLADPLGPKLFLAHWFEWESGLD